MNSFVLDCSVTMVWCFSDETNKISENALEKLQTDRAIVPSLWPFEVMNVLWVALRKKRLTNTQATSFITLLNALPIDIDPISQINKRVLELAREYTLSAYDAAYLEISLRRNIPLVTLDESLRKAAIKSGTTLLSNTKINEIG